MRYLAVITLALLVLAGCQTTDYAAELTRIRPLAEQGDAKAQTILGNLYRYGRGVTKDTKEAVRWYRKAAKQGHAWAQTTLGRMYRRGLGIAIDYKEAVRWFRLAANGGYAPAQWHLVRLEKQLRAEGNWPPRSRQAKAKPAFTPDYNAGMDAYAKITTQRH